MSAVKTLCDKIDKTFFEVIQKSVQAASYLLADLYRYRAKAKNNDKLRITRTLHKLKLHLSKSQIMALWQSINSLTAAQSVLLSKDMQQSLKMLKRAMLTNEFYLQALDMAALLKAGNSLSEYREVLIALIRKHLLINNKGDPFLCLDFSYRMVRQGGAEQNFLYLSRYIAQCGELPIVAITQLGSRHSQVAELILKDLTNSRGFFQVGALFARLHDSLRDKIALTWQQHLETYPLNTHDEAFLRKELPLLQKRHPEFRKVSFNNRITRHYQSAPPAVPQTMREALTNSAVVWILPAPVSFLYYAFTRLKQHADQTIAERARMRI
ncbi:MAG: hypothetical protein AB7I18_01300 [Candidatus Berkiella sp.]